MYNALTTDRKPVYRNRLVQKLLLPGAILFELPEKMVFAAGENLLHPPKVSRRQFFFSNGWVVVRWQFPR